MDGGSGAGQRQVVIAVEQQLWPEDQYYHHHAGTQVYPLPPMGHSKLVRGVRLERGTPLRFINIGMISGAPADVLALLQCMKERYPGFPRRCPNGRRANGSYEWVSDAPHKTRLGTFSGHWGWEQSCFHNYLFEQTYDADFRQSDRCPKLALDYRGEVILTLKKALEHLVLPWEQPSERPRLNESWLPALADVRPCVLHANSAVKAAMPVLQVFWERHVASRLRGTSNGAAVAPTSRLAEETRAAMRLWTPTLTRAAAASCVLLLMASGHVTPPEAARACRKDHGQRLHG